MARVVLENLSKTFTLPHGASLQAVQHLDLVVEEKELVVLVGPSGCGKTTTLRLIAGLEEPSGGSIHINGRLVNRLPPKDREVAMVFQHDALYPHLTVYENIAFGLRLRKCPKPEIRERVLATAALLELTPCLERRPEALSGGERQRVAVGRAVVLKPRVFLLDEPLSHLDARLRVQMRAELAKLHARLQATMIYVTHDQVEALSLGNRIVVMKEGFIQQVATPLQLYHHPHNLFVAGFIGSPPMNFFHGTLCRRADALCFQEQARSASPPGSLLSLGLPARIQARLEAYLGKEVILGLRPEHIRLATEPSAGGLNRFPATIELVEPLGAETFLHLSTGAHAFIARVPADSAPAAGQQILLGPDPDQAHFFDPQSELALA